MKPIMILIILLMIPLVYGFDNYYNVSDVFVQTGNYSSGDEYSLRLTDYDYYTAIEDNITIDEEPQLVIIFNYTQIPPANYTNATFKLFANGTTYLENGDSLIFVLQNFSSEFGQPVLFDSFNFLNNETFVSNNSINGNLNNLIYDGSVVVYAVDIDNINGTKGNVSLDSVVLEVIANEVTISTELNETYTRLECPNDIPSMIFYILFFSIAIILIYFGFKSNFFGIFGSIIMLVYSWYIIACVELLGIILAFFSCISIVYFSFRK